MFGDKLEKGAADERGEHISEVQIVQMVPGINHEDRDTVHKNAEHTHDKYQPRRARSILCPVVAKKSGKCQNWYYKEFEFDGSIKLKDYLDT